MEEVVLIDAGPIVALLIARDQYHGWAKAEWARLKPPFLCCEAVLSEAQHIVRRLGGDPLVILEFVRRGLIEVSFRAEPEIEALIELERSYADVPMSLADACLVRMSELLPRCRVMTTDSDFLVYRRNRRQVIPVICPPELKNSA
ncbi:MAG: type II toxin-antitoxin system VapC family toxin [Luteolibacter sp.]